MRKCSEKLVRESALQGLDYPDLYDYLTGIQYLNFIADIYQISQKDREERIQKEADDFEITKALGDLISSYSHGMKQKLALIGALIRQIKLLTKLQICNSFGINEVRFTKEKKKKVRFYGLAAVWVVLIACFLCYVAGMAVMLAKLNMAQFIPSALFAITSLIVFIVTFFKTGNTIFSKKLLNSRLRCLCLRQQLLSAEFCPCM